jgi:hypothetical protein
MAEAKKNTNTLIKSIISTQSQELEDAAFKLFDRFDIDKVSNVNLDRIGDLIAQSRNGQNDITYRLFLKAKAIINSSEGTIEDIISAWKLLSGANKVEILQIFPAAISINADVAIDPLLIDDAFALIKNAVVAGVRVDNIILFDPDNAFGFEGTLDSGGFSDFNNPTLGGIFSTVEKG